MKKSNATPEERRKSNIREINMFYESVEYSKKTQKKIAIIAMLKTHDESNLCNRLFALGSTVTGNTLKGLLQEGPVFLYN